MSDTVLESPRVKTLELVLSEAETRELETVDVYVTQVDPKAVSTVLRFAEKQLPPCTQLNHLKRIRREWPDPQRKDQFVLTILLCPVQEIKDTAPLTLTELQTRIDTAELSSLINPTVAAVPRHAPLTRTQFDTWRVHWPMNFREHVERTNLPSGDELKKHEDWMRHTIQLAKEYSSTITNTTSTITRTSQTCIATPTAIVVNPTTQQIMAVGYDTRVIDQHPLHHAIMNCIEAVAANERDKTTSNNDNNNDNNNNNNNNSSSSSSSSNDQEIETVLNNTKQLARKRSIDSVIGDVSNSGKGAYLCNNYDLYTIHEPCTMCAMALLHSRIGRVFYALPCNTASNTTDSINNGGGGALGSRYRIHTHPKLNHKFRVYRHLLYDEALSITEPI
ncbi:cytidine deaminase-like protein [Syncephalis fuscata]|nr:cytidine deaminase-like protein [Syncephalis fuscata]